MAVGCNKLNFSISFCADGSVFSNAGRMLFVLFSGHEEKSNEEKKRKEKRSEEKRIRKRRWKEKLRKEKRSTVRLVARRIGRYDWKS